MKPLSQLRRRVGAATAATVLVATGLGIGAPPAAAQSPCGDAPDGYNVIVSNAAVITGTSGNDFICAGDADNTINSKKGDDIIFGRAGNDTIDAGPGADVIEGGGGDDLLIGGKKADADTILGGAGNDILRGLGGDDSLDGGSGNDTLQGGSGDDTLNGGKGNDLLKGKPGKDTINGHDGADNLQGGGGNDILNGGPGDDGLAGGPGQDLLDGEDGADRLRGNAGADSLFGQAGDDKLRGGSGDDILNGGAGNDDIDGQTDTDEADGGADIDTCIAETTINCELPAEDSDGDGVPDANDNCVNDPNADQADDDGDGIGDVCEPDTDGDGVDDDNDNCIDDPNADQADSDGDGIGDVCDPEGPDTDMDGLDDTTEDIDPATNPTTFNADRFASLTSSTGGWTAGGTASVSITGTAQMFSCDINADGNLDRLQEGGGGGFEGSCSLTTAPLEVGDMITVTDDTNGAVKTLTISLTITKVERWSEMVFGTAAAGAEVEVIAKSTTGDSAPVTTTADGAGNWVADFSSLPFNIDVLNGALAATASTADAEADVEELGFEITHAGVEFEAATGVVSPSDQFDWAPGATVTVQHLDTDSTVIEELTVVTDAVTGAWSVTLTGPFAAGQRIEVTDDTVMDPAFVIPVV